MKKGVMMQGFEWYLPSSPHLWKILRINAFELKKAGITAIWLPPAYKGAYGVNDTGYGVYDHYDLGEFKSKNTIRTKYGTKKEYLWCIKMFHLFRIDVYADIVLNHLMGADAMEQVIAYKVDAYHRHKVSKRKRAIRASTYFSFPSRDKYSDFIYHSKHFTSVDYDASKHQHGLYLFKGKHFSENVDDEYENYDYLMGADLDYNNPEVVKEAIQWGLWYKDITHLDGFRCDAIKHIDSSFYEHWITTMRNHSKKELFTVGEYWGDIDHLCHYLESTHFCMSLFDVPLHYHFYDASHSNGYYDMRELFNNTLVQRYDKYAVTFVDNHDTQPGQALASFIEDWFKPQAYACILLRGEGYPCIFYGDYYGIPHDHINPKKDLLDHMLNLRRKYVEGIRHDYIDDPDVIGWTYETGLAVILTNSTGGKKRMYIGKKFKRMTDGKHTIEIIDGYGEFICDAASLNLYVVIF